MPTFTTIPHVLAPDELAELLAKRSDVRVLDVRTPGEFEAVHLRGAYNVPVETLAEHTAAIRASVTAPLVIVCRSGRRALQAEEMLREAGMLDLHLLDGSMNAWVAAGKPVVRGRQKLSLERQVRIIAGGLAALGGILAVTLDPISGLLSTAIGGGLVMAGVTDNCLMASLLAYLPYNRASTYDVRAMAQALIAGIDPTVLTKTPNQDYPLVTTCAR